MSLAHETRQLVYLLYGRRSEYRLEAKYSILSAIYHAQGKCPRILLYTDEPAHFTGWPVDVIALDDMTLAAWTGPATYLHRRKAAAIRDAIQYANQSVFVDTDTFFLASPEKLFERLEAAPWIVDEIEGVWREYKNDLQHKILAPYLAKHYAVEQNMLLVNSGVLGFRDDASGLMDETLALIDVMHPMVPNIHTVEQFAAGVAARHLGKPAEARGVVTHYYSSKKYWHFIAAAFFRRHGESFSAELVQAVSELPARKPRPVWWQRLAFRLKSLTLSARVRSHARLAYYAAVMQGDLYEEACGAAYAAELSRKALVPGEHLGKQPWCKVLSKQHKLRLAELLERTH